MKRFIAGIAIAPILFSVLSFFPCANADSWGLSFPIPGEKPKGNATVEQLLEHNAYFVDPSDDKIIYLTFDAGYENGYTEPILDTLLVSNTPAAFFLVGTYIRDNPDIIRRMAAEGHTIGNHTMNHPNMSAITDRERFKQELEEVEQHYETAVGSAMPKLYRPPEGRYNLENLKLAKELGYKTVFWSLAYADWDVNAQPGKALAFDKLIPRIHPGAILMLHSTSATNAEILGELIHEYQSMGYTFRCITELGAS